MKEFKVNEYGMPILKGMIQQSREIYQSDYVIYINSDILLNPNIFRAIYNTERLLGKKVFSFLYIITRCYMLQQYMKLIFLIYIPVLR